ncbi:MAG: threonylcarbamoyl-AMP synthase [Candidatus Omnitrophica bacterium]|nr:threonylcarbamoyl-AMP synthase [Candidatus Omnitrophota bacterium]
MDPEHPDPEAIHQAAGILRRGGLVAFPTETVYGLGANLEDPQAIQELYEAKSRPFSKPATLHIADFEAVAASGVLVSPLAKRLMARFWPGPLTLILARDDGSTLGFRMPSHPVALRLLSEARVPVVAPSANVSGAPPPRDAQAVWDSFADKIDLILDAGPSAVGVESTVLDLSGEPPRILRGGALAAEIEKALAGAG